MPVTNPLKYSQLGSRHYQKFMWLLIMSWVLVVPVMAKASEPLTLGADLPFEYYVDHTAQLDHKNIQNLPKQSFTQTTETLRLGYIERPVWIRTEIPATLMSEPVMWLSVAPPFLDRVTVYTRPAGSMDALRELTLGDHIPASDRPVKQRFLIFPIERPDNNEAVELMMQVDTSSSVIVNAALWQPAALTSATLRDNFLWGGYFSLAFISTLVALTAGLITRDRILLALAASGSVYVLVAAVQGYLAVSLPAGLIGLGDSLVGVSLFVGYASILWLGRTALELATYRPRLDRMIKWLTVLSLIATLSIPLGLYAKTAPIVMLTLEAGKWLVCLSVIPITFKREATYGLILSGYMLHAATTLASVLVVLGILPADPIVYELWQYVLVLIMAFIISIALVRLYRERQHVFNQREYMGVIAHEYRNALAVIDTTSRNLVAAPAADQQDLERRVGRITTSTRRLEQLVESCLADARMAATLDLADVESTNLLTLARHTIKGFAGPDADPIVLRLNGQGLADQAAPDPKVMIEADAALLRIALSNLLSNARKFSDGSEIGMDIIQHSEFIEINISNSGPAIPPEEQAVIFQRFRRGSNARHVKQGTGLGLFAALQITRAHGGRIRLSRSDDEQTVFTMTLPYHQG